MDKTDKLSIRDALDSLDMSDGEFDLDIWAERHMAAKRRMAAKPVESAEIEVRVVTFKRLKPGEKREGF
jgi:hypothetical protein